jgi:hypothetical protein
VISPEWGAWEVRRLATVGQCSAMQREEARTDRQMRTGSLGLRKLRHRHARSRSGCPAASPSPQIQGDGAVIVRPRSTQKVWAKTLSLAGMPVAESTAKAPPHVICHISARVPGLPDDRVHADIELTAPPSHVNVSRTPHHLASDSLSRFLWTCLATQSNEANPGRTHDSISVRSIWHLDSVLQYRS